MRIVSLIASATEIVSALGRGNELVGRSHECDYPPEVASLPALTAPKFKVEGSSAEIDRRVREIVSDGLSVYRVDAEALKAIQPDVIVTQDHCEVCAVSLSDVEAATCTWADRHVRIVSLRPDSLADVYADIGRVASALEAVAEAEVLVGRMRERLHAVTMLTAPRPKPRVAFIEWVEPMMAGGNWMPELIEIAGGTNVAGAPGRHSDWTKWEDVLASNPEVIVVAPCGYDLERCLEERSLLEAKPGWAGIDAVKNGRVYFADGNAYFNRPGPRLVETAEMLMEMIHPEGTSPRYEGRAWVRRAQAV
jgi:iron complex transport system substrate-binding protein